MSLPNDLRLLAETFLQKKEWEKLGIEKESDNIYKYKRKYITSGWVEHSASALGPIPLSTEEPEDSLASFSNYLFFEPVQNKSQSKP